jgi:purine-cytosine permease-like protein
MTPEAPSVPLAQSWAETPIAGEASPPLDSPSIVPPPPQRLSLTDDELLAAANLDSPEHDTSSLLDLVERELVLRQIEAQRLAEWEKQVRATAAPEADDIVTQVREQFTGVTPVIPPIVDAPAPTSGPTVAEQLAAAPPPQFDAPPAAPVIDLALADAPPPFGIVPSAAVAPPLSVPSPFDDIPPLTFPTPERDAEPLVEPQLIEPAPRDPAVFDVAAPGVVPSGVGALFDDLLREPVPTDEPSAGADSATVFGATNQDSLADAPDLAEPSSLDRLAGQFADAPGIAPMNVEFDSDSLSNDDRDVDAASHTAPRAGRVETVGLEPTPAELRAGRSIRLFWLWFAVNSSVVSIALGSVIMGLGVSLRQAVLATLIGVALSFLPLGLGTLAGKWSGQPTMVVSRATFGTGGNAIPALLALVTRIGWAAALLWMLGVGVAEVLVGSGLVGDLGRLELTIGATSIALVLAALVAGFGFALITVISAIVTIVSAVLVTGLIILTASYVDLDAALGVADGDWVLLLTGAVLVFSVVGLAWANSSGDVARYQAKGTYGSSAVLFTAFGATLPAFVRICWGALLAASNPVLAEGLAENPMDLVSRLLPLWYPVPLVAAVAVSLVSAAALALYSAGFALLATGLRASRPAGVAITTVLAGALVAVLIVLVPDTAALFRDVVTTLAVPVAAWAGIFGAETMIRTRRVHSPSLLRSGGVYPAVRWVNLLMLLVITAVGWGFSTASLTGLQWQGYLFTLLGFDLESALASSDPGVFAALLLGLLTPIIMGIPALRRLQRAELAATKADETHDTPQETPEAATEPDAPTVTEFDLNTWSAPQTQ